ncbi:MAG: DUF1015 domain-containing protein [Thermoplasmata archaeon]
MAKVVPFEAYHYNTARFGKDLTRFVAPPYDVIDGVMERRLKEDRLNITHITLGDEGDGYCIANRRLQTWLRDEVLVRDSGRSFYIYEQTFACPDGETRMRSGIVGLVKLEDFSKGIIMPHEKTIPKHRADRLAHIMAVNGDIEQILLLYDDASDEVEPLLKTFSKKEEDLRFIDHEGVHHRVMMMSEPELVEKVSRLLEPARIIIADGHHRYETALEYRDIMRSKEGSKDGEKPYDYILATLVSSRNPGLVVYPTHRLVQGLDEALLERLPKALEKEFALQKCTGPDELAKAVEEAPGIAFGAWIRSSNTCLLARPKRTTKSENAMEDLPVYIVQERVLKKHLNYTSEMLDRKVNIEYVKGVGPTKEAMYTGEYQACFFIKPPTIQQVMEIARAGQKMPHKSTYFFPKIWSGTLLYLFQ